MLKQQVILEVKRDSRTYQLQLPEGCNLGEVHDVLYEMRNHIISRINDLVKQDAPKELEQPKQE
jgi:predicted metal-dependent hydrolase